METNTQTLIHNVDKELPVPVLVENSDYWPHWYDKLKFGVESEWHYKLVMFLHNNFKALCHGKGYGVFTELLYIFQGKDDGLCRAPDCMIVEDADTTITDRNSYNQQTERGCPVIIFEVLSKSNTNASQKRLLRDYWKYPSLQEVFFISKDLSRIEIYQRNGNPDWWHEYVMQEGDRFTSPTLGFIITYENAKATFFTPDETPFKEFLELKAELAESIVLQKETEEYASDACLSLVATPAHVAALGQMLAKDGNQGTQAAAAIALGRIGGEEAVKLLVATLRDTERPALTRRMAANGLGIALDASGGRATGRVAAELNWCALTATVVDFVNAQ